MLHLVAEDHGDQLATEVANQILHYPKRPAEGAQRFAASGLEGEIHPDVRAAMSLLEAHIEEPIPVPELAKRLGVSQRQLERLFRRSTGCTIVQFSKLLRLQYARVLLTSTRMSIREVSAACGFNSLSYFSLSFQKIFDKKPSEYRQAWPKTNQHLPGPAPSIRSFRIRQGAAVRRAHLGNGFKDRDDRAIALGGHVFETLACRHRLAAFDHAVAKLARKLRRIKPGPGQLQRRSELIEIGRHAAFAAGHMKRHALPLKRHARCRSIDQSRVDVGRCRLAVRHHMQRFTPKRLLQPGSNEARDFLLEHEGRLANVLIEFSPPNR